MISAAQLEAHRTGLTGHCYRMLGSPMEADDAVQDTMLRAWKAQESFDGRASVKTWLYRIATNVCLDVLTDEKKRFRPIEEGPASGLEDPLEERPRSHWLEPVPDAKVIPADADPAEQVALRQSIRLAFVAALQYLPPKQRAVLLLTEVLGWSAAEVAEGLETSVPAVNSALQRARATLAEKRIDDPPTSLSPPQSGLLERYVKAFEAYDVTALTTLLREDAQFSMPPYALWLRGPEAVGKWLLGRGAACRGSRLVATSANGLPAFGQYKPGRERGVLEPWALITLEWEGDRIAGWTSFLDTASLFPLFKLPRTLER